VDAHGGSIRIRSLPGSGTTATVRFPFVEHVRTEAGPAASSSRPAQAVPGELASAR